MSRPFLVESSKNYNLLQEFIGYCDLHPNERFWQALRNWSKQTLIYASNDSTIKDTFFWEGKNG